LVLVYWPSGVIVPVHRAHPTEEKISAPIEVTGAARESIQSDRVFRAGGGEAFVP
jgi:hypothetical protein